MLMVDRAIKFLDPYFRVPWSVTAPPYVEAAEEAYYIGGVITLPLNTTEGKNSQLIGHEVGHWFHENINLEFGDFFDDRVGLILKETIASYSGLIYLAKRNPLKNPEFRLSYLSRVGLTEARKRKEEFKKFFEKILMNTDKLDKN